MARRGIGSARRGEARHGLARQGKAASSSRRNPGRKPFNNQPKKPMSNENDSNNPRRLPLWRACLDEMREQGKVHHGAIISAEFFEEKLSSKRNSMEFGLAVSAIRRELESDGLYLSGRGQNGKQYLIVPAAANADVMGRYGRVALDALKRGVILGTNTRLDLLSEGERRKHEALLERMAKKFVLVKRSEQAAALIARHDPSLLER